MSIEDFQKQSRALRPKQKVETRVIDSSDLVPTRSGANNKSSKFNKQKLSHREIADAFENEDDDFE